MENMKVNGLEHILGNDWCIQSAGGATGEAYIATKNDKKLFLKRNSSPFLAVLSAEGIVPKLIWTKRLENGDVITAQHWLNGRELHAHEMRMPSVAQMLSKIHRSTELLSMLKRIGKRPLLPATILQDIHEKIDAASMDNPIMKEALSYLDQTISDIDGVKKVVCHSDLNHNNWLLSDEEELFLIDWDGAMVADPALDLGLLLYWYIPKGEWRSWLEAYGEDVTDELMMRMKWYVTSQTILSVIWHEKRGETELAMQWLDYLKRILEDDIR